MDNMEEEVVVVIGVATIIFGIIAVGIGYLRDSGVI